MFKFFIPLETPQGTTAFADWLEDRGVNRLDHFDGDQRGGIESNPQPVNMSELLAALEAGNYDAAPSQLVQGSTLTIESIETAMQYVQFDSPTTPLLVSPRTHAAYNYAIQGQRPNPPRPRRGRNRRG